MKSMKTKKGFYIGLLLHFKLKAYFYGKILDENLAPFERELISLYKEKGYLLEFQGITKTKLCRRCQSNHVLQFPCFNCKEPCYYCRNCISMGRITSCTKLLTWNEQADSGQFIIRAHTFNWGGNLSKLQQIASDELQSSIQNKENHIIHAVCGAGKTELLFQSINLCLKRNWRICIATPRTDVVLELYPRLQEAFPTTTIHALYGGAKPPLEYSPFIIATTHQLYKFENAFDVIYVDEADAFPYSYDTALKKAVEKSKKQHAAVAFISATPSKAIMKLKNLPNYHYSFIPIRYHHALLPEPKIRPLMNYQKSISKKKLPQPLLKWVKACLNSKKPFLIFFPTIPLMEKALPLFQAINEKIESVHAQDDARKEKVLMLRNEQLCGLLTTTILERGITIKNVQVAVVGAEQSIFTASALIQIAGRVGRHKDYSDGEILFFHHGISLQMDEAVKQIRQANEKAKVYLKSEGMNDAK